MHCRHKYAKHKRIGKEISCFKTSQKKAEVVSLISDKLEYRIKNTTKDTQKKSFHKEEVKTSTVQKNL